MVDANSLEGGKHAFNGSIGFIERTGHFGIAPLISAENIFPPIPSELIMPLGGFTVARDDLDIVGAVPVGSGGSVFGSMLWLLPADGSTMAGFLSKPSIERNADQVNPVSNDVTGMSWPSICLRNATFGYKTCRSGRFQRSWQIVLGE